MGKVLTICIPAYNVSSFISKTLDSIILTNALDLIEVIVVNDGSTDSTQEIVEKYVNKYPDSIKIINKFNGNYGSCINICVANSNGKYFKIIDGDDYVNSHDLNEFINYIKDIDCDLILTPFTKVYLDNNTRTIVGNINYNIIETNFELGLKDNFEDLMYLIDKNSFTVKTKILKNNNIIIDENSSYVDLEFILYCFPFIKTFQYKNLNIYQYRVGRFGQSMNVGSLINNKDMLKNVIYNLHKYLSNQNLSEYKTKAYKRVMTAAIRTHILTFFKMKYSLNTYRELLKSTDMINKFEEDEYNYFKINRIIIKNPFLYFILYFFAKGLKFD